MYIKILKERRFKRTDMASAERRKIYPKKNGENDLGEIEEKKPPRKPRKVRENIFDRRTRERESGRRKRETFLIFSPFLIFILKILFCFFFLFYYLSRCGVSVTVYINGVRGPK